MSDLVAGVLLRCCSSLRPPPEVRFQALGLLEAVSAAGQLGAGGAADDSLSTAVQGHLVLTALGCLLLALEGAGKEAGQAESVAKAAEQVVTGEPCGCVWADDVQASAAAVRQQLGPAASPAAPTVALTKQFYEHVTKLECADFAALRLELCWTILELPHSTAAGSGWRGIVSRGGRLSAAAIVGAAFVIAAPPSQASAEPSLLSVLAVLSRFPQEVVRSNAEAILRFLLS